MIFLKIFSLLLIWVSPVFLQFFDLVFLWGPIYFVPVLFFFFQFLKTVLVISSHCLCFHRFFLRDLFFSFVRASVIVIKAVLRYLSCAEAMLEYSGARCGTVGRL